MGDPGGDAGRACLAGVHDLDVFELAAVGMVITDRDGRFQRVNDAFAELLARPREELIGTPFSALTGPDDVDRSLAVMRDLLAGTVAKARFEKAYRRPDGSLVWVDLTVRALTDAAGAVVAFLTQGVDITARKAVEHELVQADEDVRRLALVARVTPSAVVIADPRGCIQWVNDAFTRQTGYPREQVVGRNRAELLRGAGSDAAELAALGARICRGEPAEGEFHLVSTDGRPYVAHIHVTPVLEDGVVTHLIGVERDITARHRSEEALRLASSRAERLAEALTRETELLTSVISAVPQTVFWKDAEGRYVGCNAAYLAFRGCRDLEQLRALEAAGPGPDDGIPALLDELEQAVLASGKPVVDRQVTLPGPDGHPRVLLVSVLPLGGVGTRGQGVIGVTADVTQVREMERQLAHGSRLESIGQLAAGIAHEINTPVQYIAANTTFLLEATTDLLATVQGIRELSRALEPGTDGLAAVPGRLRELVDRLDLDVLADDVPSALRDSQEGLTRLIQIVRAMKDYAHPGTSLEDTDINQAVESTIQVCRNEWKYVAQLRLDLAPDVGLVPCYAGELKQVILNIVVNAAQALAEQRAADRTLPLGTITVSTRRQDGEVVVRIADDGPGMPESVRQRIFDPFFTTKGVGKGTGQGLSHARSVVVGKHHGSLEVVSAPGQGAEFVIRLLLSAVPAPDEP